MMKPYIPFAAALLMLPAAVLAQPGPSPSTAVCNAYADQAIKDIAAAAAGDCAVDFVNDELWKFDTHKNFFGWCKANRPVSDVKKRTDQRAFALKKCHGLVGASGAGRVTPDRSKAEATQGPGLAGVVPPKK